MSNGPWSHMRSFGIADDYTRLRDQGQELQFVEIELDPGESAVAEAGAFVWKDASIEHDHCVRRRPASGGGGSFMGKLLGAGKRLVTGESLFTTVFTHNWHAARRRVAFSAPIPGAILPIELNQYGGTLICQKDAFLAAAKGVSIGIAFQKKIMTGLFGGEGFIMRQARWRRLGVRPDGRHDRRAETGARRGTACRHRLSRGAHPRPSTYDILTVGGVKQRAVRRRRPVLRAGAPGQARCGSSPCPSRGSPGGCWRLLDRWAEQNRGEGSLLGGLGNLIDEKLRRGNSRRYLKAEALRAHPPARRAGYILGSAAQRFSSLLRSKRRMCFGADLRLHRRRAEVRSARSAWRRCACPLRTLRALHFCRSADAVCGAPVLRRDGLRWGLEGKIGKSGSTMSASCSCSTRRGILPLLMPAAVALMEPLAARRLAILARPPVSARWFACGTSPG